MENVFKSYYTKSNYITEYMANRLEVNENHIVLEPSAGDGVFIETLLENNPDLKISAYDINPEAIIKLNKKFGEKKNIKIFQRDTLIDEELDKIQENRDKFDRIIANPPYGGWQDMNKRELLKKKYPNHYVKETYSLFLIRSFSLLKEEGKLTFIIPDTFMFLHRHTKLRELLLLNSQIEEVLIFPSKFFPGVKFGYSNLSIITLKKVKEKQALDNTVKIIEGLKKDHDIRDITYDNNMDNYIVKNISQKEIFESKDSAFLFKSEERVRELINNADKTLGDIANCVTGIYTGNNTKYIKAVSKNVRGAKNYEVVDRDKIYNQKITGNYLLDGVDGDKCFMPIIKGASQSKYIREDANWYIDWSLESINHYKYDELKKARFQNSQYYFKRGIGLPMVKSSKIAATIIEDSIFDQSIVGVFPKDKNDIEYLLGLLNSDVIRDLLITINPTANSSANYVKKIPIIFPDEKGKMYVKETVLKMIEYIKRNKKIDSEKQNELNNFFEELYYG